MDSCLLKVSFNMPGLLKKFLSNNKLGGWGVTMRFSVRTMLVVVACFAGLLAVASFGYRTLIPPRKFSPMAWKSTSQDRRQTMAEDFVANHFRPGMSRAEIVSLLGEPDPGFPQELQYVIGTILIDYVVLWVELDDEGKAVSAFIYETS
jgi:hypothetical protein